MLISVRDLARVWGVAPSGVLHVGAHEAEEADAYAAQGWQPVLWVEMLADKCASLRARFDGSRSNAVVQGACWDEDGVQLPVHRADNDQSSSLLPPRDHLIAHPDIGFSQQAAITTVRLDSLLPADAAFEFVNIDIQGAELRALRGLGDRLRRVKWVYAEVNTRPLYEGCCLVGELDGFMSTIGFRRVVTVMAGPAVGWGDALYVNEALLVPLPVNAAAALAIRRAMWRTRKWLGRTWRLGRAYFVAARDPV